MTQQLEAQSPKETFTADELEKINKLRLAIESKPTFDSQVEYLKDAGELEGVVLLAQKRYPIVVREAPFLGVLEWQALAVLWLFDEETSDHSVNTFLIASNKISCNLFEGAIDPTTGKTLEMSFEWESDTQNFIERIFSVEKITKDQFLRSAILHDIGKVEVPYPVLTNHMSEEECAEILLTNKGVIRQAFDKRGFKYDNEYLDIIATPESMIDFLLAYQLRPQHVTPIKLLLEEKDKHTVQKFLTDNHEGLSLDSTLMDIMRIHASHSKSILDDLGFKIEAEVAGAHHYKAPTKGEKFNQKIMLVIGGIRVSIDLAHIVHLSDVEQAMIADRHYKKPESSISALTTLVGHAMNGLVQKEITYLWVADELWRKHRAGESYIEKDGDEFRLEKIKTFLINFEKNRPEEIDWPDFSKLVF